MSAAAIQRAREEAATALHGERIVWLTGGDPRWACGTPVDPATRRILLDQSRAALSQTRSH